MNWHQLSSGIFLFMLIVWVCVEFGWGGGDPNHKGHNRPPWNLW